MLLNISSDRIFFLTQGGKEVLVYGDLEKNLPDFLYSRFAEAIAEGYIHEGQENSEIVESENSTHNEEGGEKILVDSRALDMNLLADKKQEPLIIINGPGSFTNIRIATLALNTYNTLHNFALQFVSVDKMQWYAMLYKAGKVARYCVMYIGQKKNFWFVDLEKVGSESQASIADAVQMTHVDELLARVQSVGDNWFVDEVVAEAEEMCASIFGTYTKYVFTLGDVPGGDMPGGKVVNGIDSFGKSHRLRPVTVLLNANYMMQANVG